MHLAITIRVRGTWQFSEYLVINLPTKVVVRIAMATAR